MKIYTVVCLEYDLDRAYDVMSTSAATFSTREKAELYMREMADKRGDDDSDAIDITDSANQLCEISVRDIETNCEFFHATIIETELDEFAHE